MRLAVFAGLSAGLLCSQPLAVSRHDLANGMKLLIHEDHDVPNIALYLFYTVGSRNERPGITGLSHFFEHMMFNGAKKYGPKQFDIQMEKNGGSNNAYTSRDLTVYTDWFPKSALELMFDMEADRIRDLAIDAKMVESERGVVYSERRSSVDNSNEGLLREQLDATAFVAHPYQFPVIGWPSDIEAWTMEDLKAHFRMGYAPNNCIAVVAGDITEAEALRLARKYFEPIPRQDPPPRVRTKEPAQQGERRVILRKPAQLPQLMVSYHIPETKHPDHGALKILDAILTEGRSARLHSRLVERDQLAVAVSGDLDEAIDPTQYVLWLQLRADADPAKAESALAEEVDRAAGIGSGEVARARNQLLARHYRGLTTIAGKANAIGRTEIFQGDWRRLTTFPQELDRVTAADVQRVAAKYLRPANQTVGVLIPEKERK
jgi:zinc protease